MEIVSYNQANGFAYAINGQSGHLAAISLNHLAAGTIVAQLSGTDVDVRTLVKAADSSFRYGDMTSVAVSPDRTTLAASGVVLKKGVAPSADLEPEYIAVSSGKAYVTLQENNAIAMLDLASRTFDGIYSAGFEDYSVTPIDVDKKYDAYEPKIYGSLMGIRMPDAIAAFRVDSRTYLVTANEGDAREWGDEDLGTFYLNEDERDFSAVVEGSEEYEDGELDKWVTGGDVAPEGLLFLSDSVSPTGKALLLAACEVSGTVAASEGIAGGYGGSLSGPDDFITREQLAVMLCRYARYKDHDITQGGMAIREFDDFARISGYAVEAMTWAVEAGVLTETTTDTLAPGQVAARVQTAQSLLALSQMAG